MSGIRPRWKERWIPLKPEAAAASGEAAARLLRRLLNCDDERLSRLQGAATPSDAGLPGTLVIVGEQSDLPWVPGTFYLGRDARAPALYLPAALEPDGVEPELLNEAFLRKFARAPLAVLPELSAVVPLDALLVLSRPRLQQRLQGLD